MRPDYFPVHLADTPDMPLFVKIAQAIADDVIRGRLRPGDALPGSRTLANSLGVHRSTVVAAFTELVSQGWLAATPGGATRVAPDAPEPRLRARAVNGQRQAIVKAPGFELRAVALDYRPPPAVPKGTLALWGGVPDPHLVPVELLARAYRRVSRRRGWSLFGYAQDSLGHVELRDAVARWVAGSRAIAARVDNVMITRGSQMALDLLARALITPGDMVAVESPTYPNAVSTFRRAGAEVVAIPVDQQGMDLDVLTELVRRRRIRLVYTTPHHQYPTTVTLAATRRLKLLDLVERHGIALLEDDYDQEYHYDGRPVLPLASRDPKGHVIYVGTLAKVFAPGLRLAFIVAPPTLIEHLGRERALIDRQGDAALECAVAELLDDGDVQRHVRRTRRIYHQRRDAFCATTDRLLSNALCYRCPPGGLAIWAQVAPELDLELWYHRCAERGVAFQIGRHFTLDGKPSPHLRLGFAILDEKSSATALRRMADALPLRSRPRK